MIKYCSNCYEQKNELCPSGYFYGLKDDVRQCCHCNNTLNDIDFSPWDLKVIQQISDNKEFIESMIELSKSDPIEYQLKLSRFKETLYAQQQAKAQADNRPKCPHCKSTNIKSISGLNRGASIAMWGIFSKKINKSFECLNCKYTW